MKGVTFGKERCTKPTTDEPHELAEAVNMIDRESHLTNTYDYAYWLKQVSARKFDHPVDEIGKLLKKMHELATRMLKEKREYLSRGAWPTNRLRE